MKPDNQCVVRMGIYEADGINHYERIAKLSVSKAEMMVQKACEAKYSAGDTDGAQNFLKTAEGDYLRAIKACSRGGYESRLMQIKEWRRDIETLPPDAAIEELAGSETLMTRPSDVRSQMVPDKPRDHSYKF